MQNKPDYLSIFLHLRDELMNMDSNPNVNLLLNYTAYIVQSLQEKKDDIDTEIKNDISRVTFLNKKTDEKISTTTKSLYDVKELLSDISNKVDELIIKIKDNIDKCNEIKNFIDKDSTFASLASEEKDKILNKKQDLEKQIDDDGKKISDFIGQINNIKKKQEAIEKSDHKYAKFFLDQSDAKYKIAAKKEDDFKKIDNLSDATLAYVLFKTKSDEKIFKFLSKEIQVEMENIDFGPYKEAFEAFENNPAILGDELKELGISFQPDTNPEEEICEKPGTEENKNLPGGCNDKMDDMGE